MVSQVDTALAALNAHQRRYRGEVMTAGTFASAEFDRLYTVWICARWDAGDAWARRVWTTRPTGGA